MRSIHLLDGLWKAFCLRGRPVNRRRVNRSHSLERLEDRTLLSAIVVTTTADTVDPVDGVLSLREALVQAEGSVDDDIIQFSPSILDGSGKATINLTESLNQLSFNGSSAGALTIDGDVDSDGIADITLDANRTSANAGSNTGVLAAGTNSQLILNGLIFRDGASNYEGGAVALSGPEIVVTNCEFRDSFSQFRGGGLSVFGFTSVAIINSVFDGNSSGQDAGALWIKAPNINVSGNVFTSNTAAFQFGAIQLDGHAITLDDNFISGNSAASIGGAWLVGGTVTADGNRITGNAANDVTDGDVGGMYVIGRDFVVISNNVVTDNSALDDVGGMTVISAGGAISLEGNDISRNIAGNYCGGVSVVGGDVSISGNTITNNTAVRSFGGLIASGKVTTVDNNVITANHSDANVGGASVRGRAKLNFRFNTVEYNSAGGESQANSVTIAGASLQSNGGDIDVTGNVVSYNHAGDIGGMNIEGGFGALRVTQNEFSFNSSDETGGAFRAFMPGGLVFSGNLVAYNSAAFNPIASLSVSKNAGLWAFNNTIIGNRGTDPRSSALSISAGGDTAIVNNTIVDNTVGVSVSGDRVGLHNNIIAGNSTQDVRLTGQGSIGDSSSSNLIGDNDVPGLNGANGNSFGINWTTILHLTLQDHGGNTRTLALRPNSIAVNGGSNQYILDQDGLSIEFDQRGRGFKRIINGIVDIGAFELQSSPFTDIALSSTVIAENQVAGSVVGNFSATDPDANETFTYALVAGMGSSDNSSFTIQGNRLLTSESFNFEAKSSYQIRVEVRDGNGEYFQKSFTIQVTDGNDPPVVLLSGDSPPYAPLDVAVLISNAATVSDPDSPNFNGGHLWVAIINNLSAGDRLGIRNEGTGAGQIGFIDGNVTYGGTLIGTVNSAALVVDFNANATPEAVQALLRNLVYWSTQANPSHAPRTVRIQLNDGDTPLRTTVTKTIEYVSPPEIAALGPSALYSPDGPAILIDTDVTITDADSANFNGGRLWVVPTANWSAGDRFGIRNEGTGAGQIGYGGGKVTYGGKLIGTLNSAALVVDLNANATPDAVQALLRNVAFRNSRSNPSMLTRTVRVQLTDGTTPQRATAYTEIEFGNFPPRISHFAGEVGYASGGEAALLAPSTLLADLDSSNFDGGALYVIPTGGAQPGDRLSIRNQGNGADQIGFDGTHVKFGGVTIGTVTGNALVVDLNANASLGAVRALIRNLTFDNTLTAPVSGVRTIRVQLNDGDSDLRTTANKKVFVDTAPVITDFDYPLNYNRGSGGLAIDPNVQLFDSQTNILKGGTLTVSLTPSGAIAKDVVSILEDGPFTLDGDQVKFYNVVLGTWAGGTNGDPLEVQFTTNQVFVNRVQLLMRKLQFSTSASATTGIRTLSMVLTDGQGGTSNEVQKTVAVS